MKKYVIPLVAIVLVTGISCKKDREEGMPGPQPVTEKKVLVTTIAGNGAKDFQDGPALLAKFNVPFDVAAGPDGTIYITDAGSRRIRILRNGAVSTFAGSGKNGIINANGNLAQFRAPYFIALDGGGSLYSLDVSDSRIRKISAAADVSTYAGTAIPGFADGAIAVAQFRASEGGIVADAEGNIYVSDYNNQRIRKVSTSGQVSTVAGNGTPGFTNGNGETAQFNLPGGIAIDKQGNLYVADGLNLCIRKITPAGQVSTFAGSGIQGQVDGISTAAQFIYISDIVIDDNGNLYVTDDNRIRKISAQGVVSTIAGSSAGYADGEGALAKFNEPTGLGIDAQGNIYVADTFNSRIRKISFE